MVLDVHTWMSLPEAISCLHRLLLSSLDSWDELPTAPLCKPSRVNLYCFFDASLSDFERDGDEELLIP